MKTEMKEMATCLRISVDVCDNDKQDIRCGGPDTLGFDFAIDADEDFYSYAAFIQEELRKNGIPCRGIHSGGKVQIPVGDVWTKERIAECIRNDRAYWAAVANS